MHSTEVYHKIIIYRLLVASLGCCCGDFSIPLFLQIERNNGYLFADVSKKLTADHNTAANIIDTSFVIFIRSIMQLNLIFFNFSKKFPLI